MMKRRVPMFNWHRLNLKKSSQQHQREGVKLMLSGRGEGIYVGRGFLAGDCPQGAVGCPCCPAEKWTGDFKGRIVQGAWLQTCIWCTLILAQEMAFLSAHRHCWYIHLVMQFLGDIISDSTWAHGRVLGLWTSDPLFQVVHLAHYPICGTPPPALHTSPSSFSSRTHPYLWLYSACLWPKLLLIKFLHMGSVLLILKLSISIFWIMLLSFFINLISPISLIPEAFPTTPCCFTGPSIH